MELKEIKQLLSITEVLHHYSLKPDNNHRLHCPFHPDKTPSLQVYPKTNTYCCCSSNCAAGTGDQVQFIELIEKCTKHEALVKATTLVQQHGSSNLPLHEDKEKDEITDDLSRIAVLTKVFAFYKSGLSG